MLKENKRRQIILVHHARQSLIQGEGEGEDMNQDHHPHTLFSSSVESINRSKYIINTI
jgi:hypothetical protein